MKQYEESIVLQSKIEDDILIQEYRKLRCKSHDDVLDLSIQ